MRFMVMVKATPDSETGMLPSEEMLAAMGRYNEELVKAGVMLAGEGLHSSERGARVQFSGASRTVVDGPFAETKELVAGYWIFQCKSLEECIEWVKRCPNPMPGDSEIEIRQVFELRSSGRSSRPSCRSRRSGSARKSRASSPRCRPRPTAICSARSTPSGGSSRRG